MANRTKFILFFVFLSLYSSLSLAAGSVRILYTANINGALENCGCGEEPLGGLGRIKTFVDRYRNAHSDIILIDGGDFFNSYPFPALDQAMLTGMRLFAYDLIVPGDQSFIEGKDFFSSIKQSMQGKIFLSNNGETGHTTRRIKKGDITVEVTGILSPTAFEFVEKPAWLSLQDPPEEADVQQKGKSLRITVFHGLRAAAEQYLKTHQTVDLLLLAHDQYKGIGKINKALMIANGKDSEFISVIEAHYENGWKLKAEQTSMSDEYPESLEILDIIDDYKLKVESR